jgi:membrane-bound serine protease (ClpP class)
MFMKQCLATVLFLCICLPSMADEQNGTAAADHPVAIGRFVTLPSPLSDAGISMVAKVAAGLHQQALQSGQSAVLVLQIPPGAGRFGAVRDLIAVMHAPQYAQVRFVAWLPQSVSGSQLAVALACHEIVASGQSELGDLRQGLSLDPGDEQFLVSLADRGRNAGLSAGVIRSLLDPAAALQRAVLRDAAGRQKTQFVTEDELRSLQAQQHEILSVQEIRATGTAPGFNAERAQSAGFLVTRLAADRAEVARQLRLAPESLREPTVAGGGLVRILELKGMLGRATRDFATREIRRAKADRVETLVVQVDSTGGDLAVCQELAMLLAETDSEQLHTVAWIPRTATGAAAMVVAGCAEIVLSPAAEWGGIPNAGQPPAAVMQFMTSTARLRNRSEGLLQAMVSGAEAVFECTSAADGRRAWMTEAERRSQPQDWQPGQQLPEQTTPQQSDAVVFTGQRAFELGLALEPCADLDSLRQRVGIPAEQVLTPIRLTWVDRFVTLLNSKGGAFVLITLGLIFLYIELHAPSAIFGIGTVLCFSLFFWSRFLGGTAGVLELILFLLGFGLLALELLVIPGFGVCGLSGIVLVVASLIMASQTFAGLTAGQTLDRAARGFMPIAGALVTVIAAGFVLSRFLPALPWLNRMILTPPGYIPEGPRLRPDLLSAETGGPVRIGARCQTVSPLRPAGKVQVGDLLLDVVSEGGWVDAGQAVQVVQVEGNRVVVRATSV